jgi:hypothetical protein
VRFNVLGILDLIVAGVIGFLLLPSTAPLTLLPLALIPTTAVPLTVALHIVSLRNLHTAASARCGPIGTESRRQACASARLKISWRRRCCSRKLAPQ